MAKRDAKQQLRRIKQQQLVIKFPADIPPETIERIEIELVTK